MASIPELQERIDVIQSLVGNLGWRTEFIPWVANIMADEMKRLLAVTREEKLDDRLRGSIERCNAIVVGMDQKLRELKTELKQLQAETEAEMQADNPPDATSEPTPY